MILNTPILNDAQANVITNASREAKLAEARVREAELSPHLQLAGKKAIWRERAKVCDILK